MNPLKEESVRALARKIDELANNAEQKQLLCKNVCITCQFRAWTYICAECKEKRKGNAEGLAQTMGRDGVALGTCRCGSTKWMRSDVLRCAVCNSCQSPWLLLRCPKKRFNEVLGNGHDKGEELVQEMPAASTELQDQRVLVDAQRQRLTLPDGSFREKWERLFGILEGKTILVVASGPSAADLPMAKREEADFVIVTNWAWKLVPDADAMMSVDLRPLTDPQTPKDIAVFSHGNTETGRQQRLNSVSGQAIYCLFPYYSSNAKKGFVAPRKGKAITTAINSGYAAISLAIYMLGGKSGRLIITGVDYSAKDRNTFYAYDKSVGEVNKTYEKWQHEYKRTYQRMNSRLPGMIQWARAQGIEIENWCASNSPLTWGEDMRLNLGGGHKRKDGLLNVDIRPQYADAGCEMDISKLPYKLYDKVVADESIGGIFTSHCLEHVSKYVWKDVVKEWARILRPGAPLKIRVPDLDMMAEQIAKGYLDPDELFGGLDNNKYGDKEWASWHRCGFTEKKLVGFLKELGFIDFRVQHKSRGWEKHFKKTGKFLNQSLVIECKRGTDSSILAPVVVKGQKYLLRFSWGHIGDVLFISSLADSLKKKDPNCIVKVMFFKEELNVIGEHNPNIDEVISWCEQSNHDKSVIEIEAGTERIRKKYRRLSHKGIALPPRLDFIRSWVKGPLGLPAWQVKEDERKWAGEWLAKEGVAGRWVAFSPFSPKERRRLPREVAENVVRLCRERGIGVVTLGNESLIGEPCTKDLQVREMSFDLSKAFAIMERASAVVTVDCAALHMGAALGKKTLLMCGPVVTADVCAKGYPTVSVMEKGLSAPCRGCQYSRYASRCQHKECKYMMEFNANEIVNELCKLL
jgi:ADP-heptose:LPS heptosyltransferase